MPFNRGSTLVADLGEGAVRAGQPAPNELLKFYRAGIRIHNASNLHSRLLVLADAAGSTKASANSAANLLEAVDISRARPFLRQFRDYIEGLRGEPVEKEALARLAKLFNPAKWNGAPASAKRAKSKKLTPVIPLPPPAMGRSARAGDAG